MSDEPQKKRRSDDMAMEELSRKLDGFAHAAETHRAHVITLIEGQNKEIKTHGAQIQCLALGFKKFEPQLQEALERRNWWRKFWEERRAELITYGVKATFLTLIGLIVFAVAVKIDAFVRRVVIAAMGP